MADRPAVSYFDGRKPGGTGVVGRVATYIPARKGESVGTLVRDRPENPSTSAASSRSPAAPARYY